MDNGDDPLHFMTGRSRALSESVVAWTLLGSIILKYMVVKMDEALDTSHKKTVLTCLRSMGTDTFAGTMNEDDFGLAGLVSGGPKVHEQLADSRTPYMLRNQTKTGTTWRRPM